LNLCSGLSLILSRQSSIIHSTRFQWEANSRFQEDDERIVYFVSRLSTRVVRKKGYLTVVAAGSFLGQEERLRDAAMADICSIGLWSRASRRSYAINWRAIWRISSTILYHGRTAKAVQSRDHKSAPRAKALSRASWQRQRFRRCPTSKFSDTRSRAPGKKKTGSEMEGPGLLVISRWPALLQISATKITSVNCERRHVPSAWDHAGTHIKHKQGRTLS